MDHKYFLYQSIRHPTHTLTIGQRVDLTLFIAGAHFLTEDENRFSTIEQIEQFIDDELALMQKKD